MKEQNEANIKNETQNKKIKVAINKMKVYININVGSINKTKI